MLKPLFDGLVRFGTDGGLALVIVRTNDQAEGPLLAFACTRQYNVIPNGRSNKAVKVVEVVVPLSATWVNPASFAT